MSAATMNEMERLRKAAEILIEKNDAANEKNRELMVELEKSRAELSAALEREQALAAQVCDLKCEIVKIAHGYDVSDSDLPSQKLMDDSIGARSLIKRDLIKQAEVLEEETTYHIDPAMQDSLLKSANAKRQQAAALNTTEEN